MTAAGPTEASAARRAELAVALAAVEDRIMAACNDADRSRDEITLVVVTKYFPLTDVRHLIELGVRDVGESRAQEVVEKFDDEILRLRRVAPGEAGPLLTTHFIGQV